MNIKIYSEFKEKNKSDIEIKCYLCETTLREYVEGLPGDFEAYGIQREIINNVYLDTLVETVVKKKYIPSISLVSEVGLENIQENHFVLDKFRILDGLQRTYRLKLIYNTYELLVRKIEKGYQFEKYNKRQLAKEIGEELVVIDSTIQLFWEIKNNLYNQYNGDVVKFKDEFMNQKQWIEVWSNMSIDDEVEKMLLLNAGQRAVSNKHQIELLFIRILPQVEKLNKNYKIIREKDISSVKFIKVREKGQYHFSNLIAGLIAFSYGKPVTINKQLILDIKDDKNSVISLNFINLGFINQMLDFLYKLDEIIEMQYGKKGIQWLARETVIVSILGVVGLYKEQKSTEGLFSDFLNLVASEKILDLDKLEEERRNLDLSKVNIGNATKNSIYNSLLLRLTDKWGASNVFYLN